MDKIDQNSYLKWIKDRDYKQAMIAILDTAEPLTVRAIKELSKFADDSFKDMIGR